MARRQGRTWPWLVARTRDTNCGESEDQETGDHLLSSLDTRDLPPHLHWFGTLIKPISSLNCWPTAINTAPAIHTFVRNNHLKNGCLCHWKAEWWHQRATSSIDEIYIISKTNSRQAARRCSKSVVGGGQRWRVRLMVVMLPQSEPEPELESWSL